MATKLYGFSPSTCTRRVATVLAEKDVKYEMVELDYGNQAHKTPEYLKLHPFGKVPVLDDNGFIVHESRAITKYIATKYASQGEPLLPELGDLEAYALFEQACSTEQSYFDGPASGIGFEKTIKRMKGLGPADDVVVARYVAALDATLAVYDAILAKQRYLAGDQLTLADLSHLPYGKVTRDNGFKELYEKYPNVKRWWDELEARESWKEVIRSSS